MDAYPRQSLNTCNPPAQATQAFERLAGEEPARRREALEALAEQGDEEAVEILVTSLCDASPGVQQAAMNGLVRIGGPRVVTRLIQMLREPPAVRNSAIEVLERIGTDVLESILPLLGAPDPNVRKFIVDILGKQDDPRAVSYVMPLLSDPDANVRAAAAETLGHLGAGEAVPRLIGLLKDTEWVAVSAISALAEIGDPASLPPLIEVMEGGSDAVQCAAIDAMARLDHEGRCVPVLTRLIESPNPELRSALMKTLVAITDRIDSDVWATRDTTTWLALLSETLRDPDPGSRMAAITALGRLRDRRGTRLILNACRGWAHPGEEAMGRAVSALVSIGDAPRLIEAVRPDETDLTLGTVLIRTLGHMQDADAVPALAAVRLGSPHWELRKLAVQALAMIGTDEAIRAVRQAVGDPTGYVRSEAVRVLAETGRFTDLQSLLDMLTVERYADVRENIVAALATVSTHDIGPSVVALLDHPRAEVRSSAAQLIGCMVLPEGLHPLLAALNDPEWAVRQAVVEALGRYDDPRACEALVIAMSDDHEQVRLAAVIGLSQSDRPEGRTAIIGLGLRDPDVWVRYRSIERLGSRRATEAVAALTKIATDVREPDFLRRAAGEALAQIGGDSGAGESPC
jgi:HEAT repeat protein